MTDKLITCVTCGRTKHFPDGFPSTIYAECWECGWKHHLRSEHPPTRQQKRAARKQARAIVEKVLAENDLADAVSASIAAARAVSRPPLQGDTQ